MRCVFKPIGRWFGLRPRPQRPIVTTEEDFLLEKAFEAAQGKKGAQHKPSVDTLSKLARQANRSEREVERWWRQRTRADKPTSLDKFSESGWRCTYYALAFAYGCWCLSDKPWLFDTMHCWYNFPHHDMTNDVWWYYMIELGFYISLTFSQFLDVKRKDFWQMFVHHIVTIMLMAFSWTCNLTRIGTL
ncbi:ceramide synthase 6-like, partial [Tropilaelaps mercedesae]